MKKAKIVLSAVALFAVVGGALAFKANRGLSTFYKPATLGAPCTQPVDINYTTLNPTTVVNYYSTRPTVATFCQATISTFN